MKIWNPVLIMLNYFYVGSIHTVALQWHSVQNGLQCKEERLKTKAYVRAWLWIGSFMMIRLKAALWVWLPCQERPQECMWSTERLKETQQAEGQHSDSEQCCIILKCSIWMTSIMATLQCTNGEPWVILSGIHGNVLWSIESLAEAW